MILVNFLLVIGITYIVIGITGYTSKLSDNVYRYVWRSEPPSRTSMFVVGLQSIVVAAVVYLFINNFYN